MINKRKVSEISEKREGSIEHTDLREVSTTLSESEKRSENSSITPTQAIIVSSTGSEETRNITSTHSSQKSQPRESEPSIGTLDHRQGLISGATSHRFYGTSEAQGPATHQTQPSPISTPEMVQNSQRQATKNDDRRNSRGKRPDVGPTEDTNWTADTKVAASDQGACFSFRSTVNNFSRQCSEYFSQKLSALMCVEMHGDTNALKNVRTRSCSFIKHCDVSALRMLDELLPPVDWRSYVEKSLHDNIHDEASTGDCSPSDTAKENETQEKEQADNCSVIGALAFLYLSLVFILPATGYFRLIMLLCMSFCKMLDAIVMPKIVPFVEGLTNYSPATKTVWSGKETSCKPVPTCPFLLHILLSAPRVQNILVILGSGWKKFLDKCPVYVKNTVQSIRCWTANGFSYVWT